MRITAQFYTVDEAELAAAELRRHTDGIFDAAIREKPTNVHRDNDFAPMGFFTNLNTGSTSGVPVPVFNDPADAYYTNAKTTAAVVDVICRASSARTVSSILRSRGGHDIKGMG